MLKSYLYCQITHLYIFKLHSNFARMGNWLPSKKLLPGNSDLLGNYWVICNLVSESNALSVISQPWEMLYTTTTATCLHLMKPSGSKNNGEPSCIFKFLVLSFTILSMKSFGTNPWFIICPLTDQILSQRCCHLLALLKPGGDAKGMMRNHPNANT